MLKIFAGSSKIYFKIPTNFRSDSLSHAIEREGEKNLPRSKQNTKFLVEFFLALFRMLKLVIVKWIFFEKNPRFRFEQRLNVCVLQQKIDWPKLV
jgi:hypothetical protein